MFHERSRPAGRLFYLLAFVVAGLGVSWGQAPASTTISDVVYGADGNLAGGTLLISWPTFSAASGQSVAAGRKSVVFACGGLLTVALVPNTGSTPAGTFYTVVYQLDDNSTPPKYSRYTTALHLNTPL
jgi:hypothetical protein